MVAMEVMVTDLDTSTTSTTLGTEMVVTMAEGDMAFTEEEDRFRVVE